MEYEQEDKKNLCDSSGRLSINNNDKKNINKINLHSH